MKHRSNCLYITLGITTYELSHHVQLLLRYLHTASRAELHSVLGVGIQTFKRAKRLGLIQADYFTYKLTDDGEAVCKELFAPYTQEGIA